MDGYYLGPLLEGGGKTEGFDWGSVALWKGHSLRLCLKANPPPSMREARKCNTYMRKYERFFTGLLGSKNFIFFEKIMLTNRLWGVIIFERV